MIKTRRTIKEWAVHKIHNFDPKCHTVFINGEPADSAKLENPISPFDEISIKETKNAG